MDDPKWLAWRKDGITATDVANAYTGSYGGAYAVVALKLGLIEPPEQTEAMARGHRWEERIADAVHSLTGLYVLGEQAWCQHAEHSHHRATVDGMLSPFAEATLDDIIGLLETKTNGTQVRATWDRWEVQTQWQMHCTGVGSAIIARAVINDGDDTLDRLELKRIERDDFLIDSLVDLAEVLWGHIQTSTLPDPDCPSALDAVKEVTALASADAETVDLTDLTPELRRRAEIHEAIGKATEERDALDALIRSRLGAATKGEAEGLIVRLSRPRSVFTDESATAFLDIHPEAAVTQIDRTLAKKIDKPLYDELSRPIGARSLTIKEAS